MRTPEQKAEHAAKERARRAAKRQATAKKPDGRPAATKGKPKPVSKKRNSRRSARVPADSVFVFVKRVDDLPRRALAILNAIERIGSGTAEQVAAAVLRKDYSGRQELAYLSGFFLRQFVKRGAVSVA